MVLIICTSHLYIPATINIIKDKLQDVCLYTDRASIHVFLRKLYSEIDIFLLDKNHDGNSFFSRLISANRAKASLKSFFDNMKIDEIVFFHEGFCMEANWLIKYLYKTQGASVLYLPVERTFDFETKWEEDRRVKSIIKKLYCSLIWGIKVHFYKYMNSVYPS